MRPGSAPGKEAGPWGDAAGRVEVPEASPPPSPWAVLCPTGPRTELHVPPGTEASEAVAGARGLLGVRVNRQKGGGAAAAKRICRRAQTEAGGQGAAQQLQKQRRVSVCPRCCSHGKR